MEKLVYINACIRDEQSRTKKIATSIINALKNRYEITEYDLNKLDLEPVKKDFCNKRNNGIVPESDVEIGKTIANADRIVIAAPFWDMSFPSALKVFFEHASLFHITFDSDDKKCYGLCKAKKVMYITTRGMDIATGDPLEQATPYIKGLSALWGLGELTTIACQNMDYDTPEVNLEKIDKQIKIGVELAKTW